VSRNKDDSARDSDDVVGSGVDWQIRVGGADLGQGVRASDRDRVRIVSFGKQTSSLVPPDPELLGKVLVKVSIGGTHDVPA
jgi:hypothetical protein